MALFYSSINFVGMIKIIIDYYKLLKVDKAASSEEIMKAYTERIDFHKKHPYQDRTDILQSLYEARDILLNANSRKQYDEELSNYYRQIINKSKRNTNSIKNQIITICISIFTPILVATLILNKNYQYIIDHIIMFLGASIVIYAYLKATIDWGEDNVKSLKNTSNKNKDKLTDVIYQENFNTVSEKKVNYTSVKVDATVKDTNPKIDRYRNLKVRLDNTLGQTVIIEDLNSKVIAVQNKQEFLKNNKGYKEAPQINSIPSQKTKISETDRLQKMLDDYWNGKLKKSKEVIGRDYERYIGYLYEENGFSVYYQGITMGVEDGGIDLVCKKGSCIELIQCKNWGKEKIIYEKHINQLFGATIYYKNKNDKNNEMSLIEGEKNVFLHPVFVTSIQLSEEAKDVAKSLNIEVIEGLQIDTTYQSIKCNISSKGNKIYHLPFDGLYDKTKVIKKGECYVRTVREAVNLGFRHANN